MFIIHREALRENPCFSGKLEVALDVGKWVPFWSSVQMKCDWWCVSLPCLWERLFRLISQVPALITLAAHHWFKAMFQKNMVWNRKCPFLCPWHDKNHSMLKSIFVPWARGHLSHLDDDLITFCWRNACNDFLTLVFVHERQGDVIAALFSTLGFFSHSSCCWLGKTKRITLLDDNQKFYSFLLF